MSNVRSGNSYYIDTVSSNAASCLEEKEIQVIGIIYFSATATNTYVLNDLSSTGASAGALKLKLSAATPYVDLSDNPIRFPNGIWISTLDGGVLSLILKPKG